MEKRLKLEDITLCYDIYNEDKNTAVILVHGFGLNKNMWKSQILSLDEYKVIAIDARRHGQSRPCDNFNVIDVCKDIKTLMEHEKCEKAAIVGLSMGSYIAQEFVRLYPKMTSGIFVADGTPLFIKYPKWETVSLKWSGPLLKLYTWKSLKRIMAKQTSTKASVQASLEKMFSQQSKQEFISSWSGIANVLHEETVKINCPFYVVYGSDDKTGTIKIHAKDWKKEYPKCKVYEIPNAGHVSNMDNPEVFNRFMLEFLEEAKQNI